MWAWYSSTQARRAGSAMVVESKVMTDQNKANSWVDRKQITNILPPLQKQKPKGRPSSTKRNASQFEVVDATIKKKAKLMTKMAKNNTHPYQHLHPSVQIDKVHSEFNPKGDGNCGFRSLAYEIIGDEDLYGDIKDAMLERLTTHKDWYLKNGIFTDDDTKKMDELLRKRGSVSTQRWFYTPDCCQLAADTFEHPIHFHSSLGAILYLPLANTSYFKNKPIVLHLQSSHITLVKYRSRTQIRHPSIYPIYEGVCRRSNIESRLPQYKNKD